MAAIPKGSTVLVTGSNGYIGSHIVDQLLQAGYNVRGTVRTEAKGAWMKEFFGKKYGPDRFEAVVVADMTSPEAFHQAVKGCSGVAHVASNLTFKPDPNAVIPEVIAGINKTLEAADSEPSVKRFVFTSSSTAATSPKPNKEFDIGENTWNNETVEQAWAPAPYEPGREWAVYGASKTQAEQALWQFVREKKPHFQVNAVLPNANFGPILSPGNQDASTGSWVPKLLSGGLDEMKGIPPQWYVNVQDDARLHVAALMDPSIVNERIFAFAEPYTWNKILGILRKLRPDGKVPADIDDNSQDLSKVLRKGRAEEILKKNFGQEHFISLEEGVKQNIAHLS